jgi:hypothetical protein
MKSDIPASSLTKDKEIRIRLSLERPRVYIQGDKRMKRWVENIAGRKGYKSVRIGTYTTII